MTSLLLAALTALVCTSMYVNDASTDTYSRSLTQNAVMVYVTTLLAVYSTLTLITT